MSTKILGLPADLGATAARLPSRLFCWLRKKDSTYRNMAQFSRMDDRMLRDVGITPEARDAELIRQFVWFDPHIHH